MSFVSTNIFTSIFTTDLQFSGNLSTLNGNVQQPNNFENLIDSAPNFSTQLNRSGREATTNNLLGSTSDPRYEPFFFTGNSSNGAPLESGNLGTQGQGGDQFNQYHSSTIKSNHNHQRSPGIGVAGPQERDVQTHALSDYGNRESIRNQTLDQNRSPTMPQQQPRMVDDPELQLYNLPTLSSGSTATFATALGLGKGENSVQSLNRGSDRQDEYLRSANWSTSHDPRSQDYVGSSMFSNIGNRNKLTGATASDQDEISTLLSGLNFQNLDSQLPHFRPPSGSTSARGSSAFSQQRTGPDTGGMDLDRHQLASPGLMNGSTVTGSSGGGSNYENFQAALGSSYSVPPGYNLVIEAPDGSRTRVPSGTLLPPPGMGMGMGGLAPPPGLSQSQPQPQSNTIHRPSPSPDLALQLAQLERQKEFNRNRQSPNVAQHSHNNQQLSDFQLQQLQSNFQQQSQLQEYSQFPTVQNQGQSQGQSYYSTSSLNVRPPNFNQSEQQHQMSQRRPPEHFQERNQLLSAANYQPSNQQLPAAQYQQQAQQIQQNQQFYQKQNQQLSAGQYQQQQSQQQQRHQLQGQQFQPVSSAAATFASSFHPRGQNPQAPAFVPGSGQQNQNLSYSNQPLQQAQSLQQNMMYHQNPRLHHGGRAHGGRGFARGGNRGHSTASNSSGISTPSPPLPTGGNNSLLTAAGNANVPLEEVVAMGCEEILRGAAHHSLKAVELANTLRARVGTEVLVIIRERCDGLLSLLERYPDVFIVDRIPKNDCVTLVSPHMTQLSNRSATPEFNAPSLLMNYNWVRDTQASSCLHIGNVPANITESQLRREFEQFGPLECLNVVSQRGRRFAFVSYYQTDHAVIAKQRMSRSHPWKSAISFARKDSAVKSQGLGSPMQSYTPPPANYGQLGPGASRMDKNNASEPILFQGATEGGVFVRSNTRYAPGSLGDDPGAGVGDGSAPRARPPEGSGTNISGEEYSGDAHAAGQINAFNGTGEPAGLGYQNNSMNTGQYADYPPPQPPIPHDANPRGSHPFIPPGGQADPTASHYSVGLSTGYHQSNERSSGVGKYLLASPATSQSVIRGGAESESDSRSSTPVMEGHSIAGTGGGHHSRGPSLLSSISESPFDERTLKILCDDTYVPTQHWQIYRDIDGPFCDAIVAQLQQLGGSSTVSKLRGTLRNRIGAQNNIKSVPLKAFLTAYPEYFVLNGNLVGLVLLPRDMDPL